MGRLPALSLLGLVAASLGCDRTSGASDAGARSETVLAAASAATSATATASAPPPASADAPPRRAGKLCEGQLDEAGRKLPPVTLSAVTATGAKAVGDRVVTGKGRWTWINFFAAWCGPCKEEMPRLRKVQQQLASRLDVAFISLDDDERQLKKFLEAQPAGATGVRSAQWLEPGKKRLAWLSALDLEDPPKLPAHVLVDPAGKVRCVLAGAIDEADLPTIAGIVRR